MHSNSYIKLTTLFLLLVFSVNLLAICPCSHSTAVVTDIKEKKSCCCKASQSLKDRVAESKKECSCEKKIIKFYQLEKQLSQHQAYLSTTELPAIHAFTSFSSSYFYKKDTCSSLEPINWWYLSLPDYNILYQQFLI